MNWNPFNQYNRLFDEDFKKIFRGVPMNLSNVIVPSVDMYEKDNNLIVEFPLPGVDAEKVNIEVDDNNVLTIKGKVEKTSEVDDKNYYRKETKVGSFHRSIVLPINIEADNGEANYEEGILKVVFPKIPEKKPKQIKVAKKKNKK